MKDKMKVITLKVGEKAKLETIDISNGRLEAMQKLVIPEGSDDYSLIEPAIYYDDGVVLIWNEEGLIRQDCLANRAVYNEKGDLCCIIFGPAFICGDYPELCEYGDIPDNMINKYIKKYYYPEMFINSPKTEQGFVPIKYIPIDHEDEIDDYIDLDSQNYTEDDNKYEGINKSEEALMSEAQDLLCSNSAVVKQPFKDKMPFLEEELDNSDQEL